MTKFGTALKKRQQIKMSNATLLMELAFKFISRETIIALYKTSFNVNQAVNWLKQVTRTLLTKARLPFFFGLAAAYSNLIVIGIIPLADINHN